jgi:transketolase
MPCWELFEEQDRQYQDEVLPPAVRARVSIEAGVTSGWQRWVGDEGSSVGIDGRFGASAPYQVVLRELGFTAEHAAACAQELVDRLQGVRA